MIHFIQDTIPGLLYQYTVGVKHDLDDRKELFDNIRVGNDQYNIFRVD